MRFVPAEADDRINVPEPNPLPQAVRTLLQFAAVLVILYLGAGVLVDAAIPYIPVEYEGWLSAVAPRSPDGASLDPPDDRVGAILERLCRNLPEGPMRKRRYRLFVTRSTDVNAFALPGGTMLLNQGLLDRLGSDGAVAMCLGHELGHFAHRDHLRGLGRSMALVLLLALVTPAEASRFAQWVLTAADRSHSQEAEAAADRFGLDLVHASFGHVGGCLDLFETLRREEENQLIRSFLSTHPSSDQRLTHLRERIASQEYRETPHPE